jgi:hypothetical protein
MKRISVLSVLMGIVLLLGLPITGDCWIGDRQLRLINERIEETEAKLFQLDQDQLLNWLKWTDWGIDLLNRDIKEMEKEIQRWEEMRNAEMNSEEAWREWERAGRELDELDRKKTKLDRTLEALKGLRDRLRKRLRQLKGIPEYKPFRLGLGIGLLSGVNDSIQIWELKLRVFEKVDLFYGSDGEEEEKVGNKRIAYYGGEIGLRVYSTESSIWTVMLGGEKFSF